jgi:arylsulfatase A-like enzyme
VDLAPSALAAAGIRADDAPGAPEGGSATYGEATLYGVEQKFLRTDRWKLVLRLPDEGEAPSLRLYDLRSDPGERVDLASVEPARADSHLTVLEGWIERVGSEGAAGIRDRGGELDPAIRGQLKALGYLE